MGNLSLEEAQKLEALFLRFERVLLFIAQKYVGQQSDAEDIVLEAFIRIIPHLSNIDLKNEDSARSYLITVVEHLAIDSLRKKRFLPLKENIANECLAGEEMENHESRELLVKAMKKLKPQDEQILKMKYIEGMNDQEMSELLSIKQTALRKRLERARKRLKNLVTEEAR